MKNNIIRPTGLKGNEKVNRMRSLMGMSPINESAENTRSVVELKKLGPDGKVYGIVRENHEYYIKTAVKKPNLIAEDFKYIGGLKNKKEVVYESYAKAIKQLNLKFISLNEALGNVGEVNTFLNESFESYNEKPKPSQPDTLMGTVKSPGKNDGHESEIINDSGETGNPDVKTPPVVEEDDVVEGEEAIEEDVNAFGEGGDDEDHLKGEEKDDDIELTEGEKAIDRMILENKTPAIAKKVEGKVEEVVVERRMSIATALQKIDEGVNSQKKKK